MLSGKYLKMVIFYSKNQSDINIKLLIFIILIKCADFFLFEVSAKEVSDLYTETQLANAELYYKLAFPIKPFTFSMMKK